MSSQVRFRRRGISVAWMQHYTSTAPT
uniref:Uncharacterized protein n=1 Tax=Arundo donax TaxID=35708 RepID=A0A0A9HPM5_ARUDO